MENDVKDKNRSFIKCSNHSCSDNEVLKSDSHGTGGGPCDDKKYKSRVIYNSKFNKATVEASLAYKGKRFKPLTDKKVVPKLHQKTNPPVPYLKVINVLQLLSVVQSFPSLKI